MEDKLHSTDTMRTTGTAHDSTGHAGKANTQQPCRITGDMQEKYCTTLEEKLQDWQENNIGFESTSNVHILNLV